jgi:1,4-alpha-glucan branching enzyme
MTPVPRRNYRIGVPQAGQWREIANTDSRFYGGSDVGNFGTVGTAPVPTHGEMQSLELTLPPLATIMLSPEG